MTVGSDDVGDNWLFIGMTLPFNVPNGRIRPNAFGEQAYLGSIANSMIEAGLALEKEITDGVLQATGTPDSEKRDADIVYSGGLEGCIKVDSTASSLAQGRTQV